MSTLSTQSARQREYDFSEQVNHSVIWTRWTQGGSKTPPPRESKTKLKDKTNKKY
jgi:hypothetical protein